MRPLAVLLLAAATLPAVEWTWTWKPAAGAAPTASVCPLKYGKTWAYAIEIDDNPDWIRSFAVPFLAKHQWSDAPPGVPGGKRHPFVGGVGVIAGGVDAKGWEGLAALTKEGWGVINHSFSHSGRSWGDEAGRMDDAAVAADAFWSQVMFATNLGRAPTAAIYANGYTDYNRNRALEKVGIVVGTRVAGSQKGMLAETAGPWMDIDRSYLDEGAWKDGAKGDPLTRIADPQGEGPEAGRLFVDFTHGIDQKPESENQRRWVARLTHIASRWGAAGKDTLWCAPTGEIADYARLAKAAKIVLAPGKLTLSVPDGLPGSALTLRLDGFPAKAVAEAPAGGVLYRQDGSLWLTTPVLGVPGAPAPAPQVRQVATGKPGELALPAGTRVAAVIVRFFGAPAAGYRYQVALKTPTGERRLADADIGTQWINGTKLHPLIPGAEAVPATAVTVAPDKSIQEVRVWALE